MICSSNDCDASARKSAMVIRIIVMIVIIIILMGISWYTSGNAKNYDSSGLRVWRVRVKGTEMRCSSLASYTFTG